MTAEVAVAKDEAAVFPASNYHRSINFVVIKLYTERADKCASFDIATYYPHHANNHTTNHIAGVDMGTTALSVVITFPTHPLRLHCL